MRFHLIMVFWGERFAHHLCEEALPALLAAGNLPDWPWLAETSLELYCPAPDWQAIADTPILQQVQAQLSLNWHAIETPQTEHKYAGMGQIHAQAIEAARQAQAAVILLGPDCVFCEGSFQVLAEQIQSGTDMVLIPGQIVSREQFLQQQSGRWSKAWGQNLIAQAAHPSFRAAHLSQAHFLSVPSALLYSQNGHLKGRFFHLHPLLIRQPLPMKIENYQFSPTIDGEYLQEFGLSVSSASDTTSGTNATTAVPSRLWIDQHQAIVAFSLLWQEQLPEGPFLLVCLQTPDQVDRLPELETGPNQAQAQTLVLIAPAELLELALAHETRLSAQFEELLFWEEATLAPSQLAQLVDQALGVILEGHFCYFNLALRACLQGNLHAIL